MLQNFSNWLVYEIFKLTPNTPLTEATVFFIYDSLKIIVLLVVITHFMSLLRYFLPIEKIKEFLSDHNFFGADYFLATVFGAVTPFCSCSSIPLFIGFLEAGIPLGVTFSFLITSPLINEVALALFMGLFGWKVTLVYSIAGILVGMAGGFIISKINPEKYLEDYIKKIRTRESAPKKRRQPFSWKILKEISQEAREITKKIIIYVLVGVGLGALIHGYVPSGFFENYITENNPLAVPLAVILAVPLYSNAGGVIPIIQSLVAKGIPLGTALAFMMAVIGLSLPEALILKKMMKIPLLLIFFGIVALGIIIIGYGFNLIF